MYYYIVRSWRDPHADADSQQFPIKADALSWAAHLRNVGALVDVFECQLISSDNMPSKVVQSAN